MSEPVYVSIGPVGWAIAEAPGLPPQLLGVLVALAMHADAEGCNAYPSQEKLALFSRKSERQVRTDLAKLEELGLIRRGDQDRVRYLPLDKRPIVWDLATERERGEVDFRPLARGLDTRRASGGKPTSGGEGKPTSERGEAHFPDEGKPTADEVISEQPENNHVEVTSAVSGRQPGAPLRYAPPEEDNWHLADEPTEADAYDWTPSPEDVAFVLGAGPDRQALARRRAKAHPGRTVEQLIESTGVKSTRVVPPAPTVDVHEPLRGIRRQPHVFEEDRQSPGYCKVCDFPEGNRAQHPTTRRA